MTEAHSGNANRPWHWVNTNHSGRQTRMKTKSAIHVKEAAGYPDGETYMGVKSTEDPHKRAQRALEAAAEHGYPADKIREIQTLLEETASR